MMQGFDFINPFVLGLVVLWSLPWKGWALWRAARNNHNWWFIAILLINTVGLLEIVYIFFFSGYRKVNSSVHNS